MKRSIITIDESKCTGCGLCIPGCPEGALQIIDGKARLVSDLMCDGLGACIGTCPEGAITIEEREAEPYDERKVMEGIVRQGPGTIRAHLAHLKDHGQTEYLNQAVAFLREKGIAVPTAPSQPAACAPASGCPGSRSQSFGPRPAARGGPAGNERGAGGQQPSELSHWPVQMHLINPAAPHFQGADLVLAADCVAYALGDFHRSYLRGKTLAIACPKLDERQEVYLEKLKTLIEEAKINTLTVTIMEVPCCRGLVALARAAAAQASRKVPVKVVVVGVRGDVLSEEWVA
ncbi:MAG: 4Fe-4S binding protein [Candidatus Eisenbacteria bacterium]|nr:4Fe-4S binding protein [Candidatus Eisenbacteria bacterium]